MIRNNQRYKAFPCEESYGMTLRDYFAAKAMQALITKNISKMATITDISYKMADFMLEEREKNHGQ